MDFFNNLSPFQKGIGALVLGITLILYTVGWLHPIMNYVITTAGIY